MAYRTPDYATNSTAYDWSEVVRNNEYYIKQDLEHYKDQY
jgi:hypothetical protein